MAEEHVRFVAMNSTPKAVTTHDVERASSDDAELQQLRECIDTGRWTDCPDKLYDAISGELCVIGQLVLRGSRIVMPGKLRPQALALEHEGHLGIVGTKQALRSYVWWPGIERESRGNILQIMPWVPASGKTRRTRTNKVNYPSSGTVDGRRRRPTGSATFWTLNTSCGGLLQPVLRVQHSPVHNDRESVGQPRRYIQSAMLAGDNQVWQRTAIPIRRVWWILHALCNKTPACDCQMGTGQLRSRTTECVHHETCAHSPDSRSELEERTADTCDKVPWSTT